MARHYLWVKNDCHLVGDLTLPSGRILRWARRSISNSSFARLPTGTDGRVHDSGSLEWSASSEPDRSPWDGNTAQAVDCPCPRVTEVN